MTTVEDLRNPDRKSGFNYVAMHLDANGGPKAFAAQIPPRLSHTRKQFQIVPMRDSAEAAAQDVVDYLAGRVTPASPKMLKKAGHKGRRRASDDPEVQAALGVLRDAKGQRQGKKGWVYLIIEVHPGGGLVYGKVGYSTNPPARVAELQTGNPRPLKLHALKEGTTADESALHAKYIHMNVLQEWFSLRHADAKNLLLEFDLDDNGVPWGAAKENTTP